MADDTYSVRAGESALSTRPLHNPRSRVTRRLLVDRVGRHCITLGGMAIIASILAILFVIAAEVYPLFKRPTTEPLGTFAADTGSAPLRLGVGEYREVAYLVTVEAVRFLSLKAGKDLMAGRIAELGGAAIVATSSSGSNFLALGLSDGRVIPAKVNFNVSFPDGKRQVTPELIAETPLTMDPTGRPIRKLAHATAESGPVIVGVLDERRLAVVAINETTALIGPSTREEIRRELSLPVQAKVTALALDNRGEDLFVGTAAGELLRIDLRDPAEPKMREAVDVTGGSGAAVSALGFLLGDRTLIVGDTQGAVSSWQLLRSGRSGFRLAKIHDFDRHGEPVVSIARSWRNKGFATAGASGRIRLHYGTTGKTLLNLSSGSDIRAITLAPKADGILSVDARGTLTHWSLDNPHPETTWQSLFGKIWYEGYSEPEYVWQSTGGTDDFEPKLSLTPLIFGTLKGTFYALVFAVPLALMGALYTSQFMHPRLKGIVKPTVEIMAALPSVVLGFIAGLWLAPMLERVVPGVFLFPVVIPALILLSAALWRLVPSSLRYRIRAGTEVFLLVPVVLLGAWLAFYLGSWVEMWLLSGDYRVWLLDALGLTYDQRNSMVVGFAMGFAVIPIIFTIAEDSLSNVPQSLVSGSLALGATRWQTATRLVLPTASPGIFSAVMIGFGRAVGETMIVLMATGNTPVMDWSIFNGFRALSANIAVELPEAPVGGTLYRVLFLAAMLLFVMTFVVNTAAELVRLRLRRKYQTL